jgi:thiamine-monophosphate kinase
MPPVPKPRVPSAEFASAGGEEAALSAIREGFVARFGPGPAGEIWIGDDAAVVHRPEGSLVLAVDAAVEGVHADLTLVTLADMGWKAMAAAISDVGAMGARPMHALVTLCTPPDTDLALLNQGVADAAATWDCPVVGGDLSLAGQVVVNVAVTGVLEPDLGPPVPRSGASPDDLLFLTGPVGAAAAGLRVLRAGVTAGGDWSAAVPENGALVSAHRRPLARVAEGRAARAAGATAMIDVSDGLALDLHRLATASGVGIDLDEVPVAPGATTDEALGGGEDYELVIAIAGRDAARLTERFAASGLRPPLAIGRCTGRTEQRALSGRPLPIVGWQHNLG